MRLLLDTQVFLWLQTDPARLRQHLVLLEDATNVLLVSAVVAWEIAIKHALGRLPLPQPPASYVPDRVRAIDGEAVAVSHAHALGVASLPALHRDPFDRLLVAQALVEKATLVTGDAAVARYPAEILLV